MNKLNHIAFIMDGNGRWGKKNNKGRNFGHLKGVQIIEKLVKYSIKLQIPILTFYTFSTENWKRPRKEITFLFKLIKDYFDKEINNLVKNDIKINIIDEGDGIAPKEMNLIFDRFFRTASARASEKTGSGLGLAIVKNLVNSLNGKVGVDSNEIGSTFWFTLPKAK